MEGHGLLLWIDSNYALVVALLVFGEEAGHFSPYSAGAALLRESEDGVGSPPALRLVSKEVESNKGKLKRLRMAVEGEYRSTFSTTFATLAVATRSPSHVHCIFVVGTAHTLKL